MNAELPLPSSIPPLLVVGAGKLGSAVTKAWNNQGGTVRSSVNAGDAWTPQDLVFEATAPDAAFDNILRCVQANVPVVTGTTGWLHQLGDVEEAMNSSNSTVFWSTNFSPGVHALNQSRNTPLAFSRAFLGTKPTSARCITCTRKTPRAARHSHSSRTPLRVGGRVKCPLKANAKAK